MAPDARIYPVLSHPGNIPDLHTTIQTTLIIQYTCSLLVMVVVAEDQTCEAVHQCAVCPCEVAEDSHHTEEVEEVQAVTLHDQPIYQQEADTPTKILVERAPVVIVVST